MAIGKFWLPVIAPIPCSYSGLLTVTGRMPAVSSTFGNTPQCAEQPLDSHKTFMIILGITGSIGTGKTTLAKAISKHFNAPVFDADLCARQLTEPESLAYSALREHFPDALADDGTLDRPSLRALVLKDKARLKILESILHPHVRSQEEAFIKAAENTGLPLVILDIPLLFETGADSLCTHTLCTYTDEATQVARIKARGLEKSNPMQDAEIKAMIAQQMPQAEKQKRASASIDMSQPLQDAILQAISLVSGWLAE